MRVFITQLIIVIFLTSCAGLFGRPSENVVFTVESVDLDSDIITEGANILGSIIDILTGRASQRRTDMPLNITLRVKNNNDFPIDITRITYDLRIQDYDFGRGELIMPKGSMKVEPYYDRLIRLPLNVPYTKVIERVVKGLYMQDVEVIVRGEATATHSNGEFMVPYITKPAKMRPFK